MSDQRSRATQAEILKAFRDRLRHACPGCTDQTCFIADQPIPAFIPAGGGACVTVSMGPGVFDQRMFAGGGHETLCEESKVIITPIVRNQLDRVPQAERSLLADDRGLVAKWKRDILRALLLDDPSEGHDSPPWEPTDGNRPLCREQIRPITVTPPADVPDREGWFGFHLIFEVLFDWDLSP